VLSDKDLAAPMLAEAAVQGLLPSLASVEAYLADRRA